MQTLPTEKGANLNELQTYNYNLPTTIEDLSKFVLIGREQLNAVRAAIRAIDKVGLATEVREQKLQEAQDLADAVLDAEVRIGELTAELPKAKSNQYVQIRNGAKKQTKLDDIGITKDQASRFEQLAKHPEAVEQAKTEAREKGEVVTRSAALNKIKEERKAAHRAEREQAVAEQIKTENGKSIDLFNTTEKYRVIYADPPWSYGDKQNIDGLGGAVKHYPTMKLEEICELPIPAEDNAVLFLWVTSPLLEDSFKVINAWGFKYKTSFVWDKIAHNMGHYNSVRHEFLLVATKGSCTPDNIKLFDSVVSINRTEHSKKPEEFRNIIDTLYTYGKKLELFARDAAEGWDVWGNMI